MTDLINNRYQIVQQLGKGGMGAVYLVQDALHNNQTVALKTIRADLLGEHNLAQFKYEFAALGQLRHPNLVAVFDFGVIADTGEYFFTMENVPGEDLSHLAAQHIHSLVPDQRPGTEDQPSTASGQQPVTSYTWLYEIVVQVCRALQYIHSHNFIHYDVKPRNIRITPQGQVKLMDFGLVGEARGEGQLRIRGTPEYVAPELVRGDPVDHRADLYSLGVSLYEIMTGRLPFRGDSSMLILKQHVEAAPEPPRHLVSHIPEGLQNLILKLMAKEPANRYSNANDVIQAINELSGSNFPVETKETRRGYIQSGNFVGREFELARLQGLLMRATQGQGRLILIAGAAGMGKTRLVRELRLRAQMQRALVCEGVCLDQTHAPYQPWISILSQVISYQLSSKPEAVGAYGGALVKLMPALEHYINLTESKGLDKDSSSRKQDLMDATARFLLTCDRPLLVILEDLHHADAETLELLNTLGQRAPRGQLLLCGVYRNDELDEVHPLNILTRQAHLISRQHESRAARDGQPYDLLCLEPLTEEDTADLVKSMLGVGQTRRDAPLPAGLLPRLMAESGGNPLFIESIMRSLVEEDWLQYDGETWRMDVANLTRIPSGIQEVTQRLLARLAKHAEILELLQWAAVMGQWLDMNVLMAVCSLEPDRVFSLLAGLGQQNVMVTSHRADQDIYRFSNDHMREAVYATLSPDQRAVRHQLVAETLRRLYDESDIAESLAWHFEQAGDLHMALHYSRLAADKARQVYANESAVQHYSRALALIQEHPGLANPQTEYDLLTAREDCHGRMGNRRAQQADLETMTRLAQEMGEPARQIKVTNRQVALANMLGDYIKARRVAEEALDLTRQIGDRKLETDTLALLNVAYFRLGEFEHAQTTATQGLQLCRELGDRVGEANALQWLGHIARRQGKVAQAQDYYEQSLALCQAMDDRKGEADALNALGILTKDYAQARHYYEQSLAIVRAIGDKSAQARSYNNLGLIYANLGLYSRARDYLVQAVQTEREIQGRYHMVFALETLGRTCLEMGEYAQAQQVLEEGRALAIDSGARLNESLYWLTMGRVALARGRLAEARELARTACDLQRELGTPGFLATSLAWLGTVYLTLGDWEAGHHCTSEAVATLEATGNAGDYPVQDIWWQRYQVLKAAPFDRAESDALEAEAGSSLQRAHDAMMASIATLSDGGLRRNYLNKVRINNAILTEWTRQSVRQAGPQAMEGSASPEAGAVIEPDQAQDKLKRVLDISLQMVETRDIASLLNYVMDQVIELSGAERSFLVLTNEAGDMDFRVVRGIAQDELERAKAKISHTVLGAVAQSKRPVLLQDALADERFGQQSSVLELSLRSVLCVPLLARAELIGMIYADNRSVSGRFSQTDVDLMTIFANQAATAIENARLYQETLTWAHTLEQRVAERTAELSRRAMQLQTSSQVGRQVTSILDLDQLLAQVVQLIQSRFGYYYVGIWLTTDKKDAVALRAGAGRASETLQGQELRISMEASSIIVSVCKSGASRSVDDVSLAPDYMPTEELPDTRSELALPLHAGAKVIGALNIESDQLAAFGPEDIMVMQTLADQIATAIRNAQLYQLEQRRRRLAESLEQTGRELSSSLDLSQVPGRILDQLAVVVPYERGSVLLRQGDATEIIAQRGFPQDAQSKDMRVPIREGDVFQQLAATSRPIIADDVTSAPGWQQLDWLPINLSWMGVPLISQDRVIGMISLTRREAAAFSLDDATLVSAFAGQAAIALENASLYAEITRLNEHLEQMVAQRTQELQKAYQTLEKMDQAKSDFIEIAAHELRTPLTLIKGYAQLLESTVGSVPDAKLLLDGIMSGQSRLHEIVNSLLDVTKISSQVLEVVSEPTRLEDIIRHVHSEFRSALNERRLTFTTTGLDDLPLIQADPSLLSKVFYHLVVNAIKFTPDGGSITVTGRLISEVQYQPVAEVVVSDTGIGIDPAHHELIFEKFYQTGEVASHSSGKTKFKGGGPGLGLSIAKGIVEAHGGRIWVESEAYDEERCPGSHFHVCLPVTSP